MKKVSLFVLLLAVFIHSCNEYSVEVHSSADVILNDAHFMGKSVGEVHNIVVTDLLLSTKVSSKNTEKDIHDKFQQYFDQYNIKINDLGIPISLQDYKNFDELILNYCSIVPHKKNDIMFVQNILEELDSYVYSTDSISIEHLQSVINKHQYQIEKDLVHVSDKELMLNSLDVFSHSIQLWMQDFPLSKKAYRTEHETDEKIQDNPKGSEKSSCTLKVAAIDALGYIVTVNVGGALLSSAFAYITTCN